MDINVIRGLATLAAFIAFISVVCWAYSKKRKDDFDQAAALPFADEPQPEKVSRQEGATEQ